MKVLKAKARVYLDRNRPKKDGKCSVKIKVTYNRKRRYYPLGVSLTVEEFERMMDSKKQNSEALDEIETKYTSQKAKANDIIDKLNIFTFSAFEAHYLTSKEVDGSVSAAFDEYIEELESEDRIGTASTYICAKNSLDDFEPNLAFAEITPKLLNRYEKKMLDNGKSLTTVGIYLRSLRAVYNAQEIDKSLYPFGAGKKKYSIPMGSNVKKALTAEQIEAIYNYDSSHSEAITKARDYWIFLFLCNGLNVKDFCLLKWGDIDGDTLTYQRAKTIHSKKKSKLITVALKEESKRIIREYGVKSLDKSAYIFPHINKGMSATRQREVYQQVTQRINKNMRKIGNELGIDNLGTYAARHSFATILKRSGANIALISDLLGHSSLNTTESYLAGFEIDQIKKQTDVLSDILVKKAN